MLDMVFLKSMHKDTVSIIIYESIAKNVLEMPIKGERYICDILREFEDKQITKFSEKLVFRKHLDVSKKDDVLSDLVELQLIYAEVCDYIHMSNHV